MKIKFNLAKGAFTKEQKAKYANAKKPYTVKYSHAYSKLPKPARDGYKFITWWTGSKSVDKNTIVTNGNTHTLKAIWAKKGVTKKDKKGKKVHQHTWIPIIKKNKAVTAFYETTYVRGKGKLEEYYMGGSGLLPGDWNYDDLRSGEYMRFEANAEDEALLDSLMDDGYIANWGNNSWYTKGPDTMTISAAVSPKAAYDTITGYKCEKCGERKAK